MRFCFLIIFRVFFFLYRKEMENDSDDEIRITDDDWEGESDDEVAMADIIAYTAANAASSSDSCEGLKSKDYQVLTQTELIDELNSLSTDTSAVLHYNGSICKALLHHYKWNKVTLIERYYEAVDMDTFFKNANLLDPSKYSKIEGKIECCKICFEKRPLKGLLCNHLFCSTCWSSYLSNKILSEGHPYISCPELKCAILADDEFVLKTIKNPQALRTYNKLILNSFVECNALMKWCPAPECGRAIKVSEAEPRKVQCICGFVFCFGCSQQWHEPVDCEVIRRWLKKCSDDSETSNWLSANTKDCPKCHVTIEKDGGCNHMTCKNLACKFEFCWMCLGPWAPHGSGWYSCNRYDDEAAKKARDAQERSRAALQRYLHYFSRFQNHQSSLKFERKLFEKVSGKMEQLQGMGSSWIETQYLRKAVEVLVECRRTLMYTYVFAFYLVQNNITKLFEDNQSDLEIATEHLSELLERDISNEEVVEEKQKVQDKYRYVEQRRLKLLKHCAEGYERNEWKFCQDTLDNKLEFKRV